MEAAMKEKADETIGLVDFFIQNLNERGVDPGIAVAAAGQFFAAVCNDCSLNGEQFLYLCSGIAERMKWRAEEMQKELDELASPSGEPNEEAQSEDK